MKNNNSLENKMDEFVKQLNDVSKEIINNMVKNDILELDDEELDVMKLYVKMFEMLEDIMIESAKSIDNVNEKLDTLLEIKNEEA